ncbi:ATP-binding sensor histidine kinase [Microcoleus sp. FACHB-672]|uniref:trifunctional serine/threonine-protein kinase/ATP-binding protein/sensor histidine kinase n=1 Tax=Microcoleus sp. FACHB-672 TaxID=2692825 RepID=UPI001687871A|nr:ATP-binding sensor histidine kinase [Microcoleus sp. FACHB-672]MBD2042518.1 AAA family ATPase [Microcoleus sp. FACHB-672]
MIKSLSGYQLIEAIHEGVSTIIYRGAREPELTSVIIKTLKAEYPSLEALTRLRHEYKILEPLNIEGIVKPYSLENYQNGLALILEDFSGASLKNLLASQKIQLRDFLKIAIQLALILEKLHKNHIIHKDIKPHNIIINKQLGQVKIIDFSIATRLSAESPQLSNPSFLEGTLAYMSPEQTGRMNRSIDYRTDFYSLGVTFYEILAGRLPFQSTDPLELVHCHIAKMPVSPHQLNSEIPKAVSDIVMKLLAKTAEDRYQTALGLKADLEACFIQLETTGTIGNFIVGERDKSGQFLIPQKLYGRDAEVAILMNAFVRVACPQDNRVGANVVEKFIEEQVTFSPDSPAQGKSEMMLVAGYSGIGKSALVNEIHKPIVAARGYFIAGKFDQYKRNIPYASLIQAFQSLMRQLLTESSEQIEAWKQKLLEAFGPNGQVIIDVIPEVELIVGKQQPVPQLGAAEAQNRFNRVFQQFIHVFTKKEHPLVLFLDDLQWADLASLKLIELLITEPESQYLLLIGAYRDNEVSATHPFMITLEEIQKAGAIVNTITLGSLKLDHVTHLIAETTSCSTEKAKSLADLVLEKTGGNPFFLTQLLKSLHSENLLAYDIVADSWHWEIEQIQAVGITENVVELMISQIQKLPDATQNVLKLAACIGNQFNLEILAIVNEKPAIATAGELWPALQRGLILPLNSDYKIPLAFDPDDLNNAVREIQVDYKFLHDRVQQAAYALIPADHKKEVHLKVGQLLLQNMGRETLAENLFDIVNHLNIGVNLITEQKQKDELAALNLTSGRRAKAATAYEAALRYLNVAIGLLAIDSWQSQYDLTLALYVEAVEVQYLNTNFEPAETLAEVVLKQANTLLERMKVYELKIQMYTAQLQMAKAVDTGLQALEMIGVSLSNVLGNGSEKVTLPRLEDLEDIPEMTDAYKLAAMRLLMALTAPAYQAKPDIFPLIIFTQVNLCIEHGHSPLAAFTYSWYGLVLCGALGDIESGYHAGLLALKLLDKFDARELKCTVINMFNVFIRPWKRHIRETMIPLMEGLQSGLEVGDLVYASFCASNYCAYIFTIEEKLESIAQKQVPFIDLLPKLKNTHSFYYASIWRQLTLNLLGLAVDKYRLIGESFDEQAILPKLYASNDHFSLFNTYTAKTILLYLAKESAEAIVTASLAEENAKSAIGLVYIATHKFYYSLALLAEYAHAKTDKQQQYMTLVESNQEKMKKWADHCPSNFQHKYELVEAEKARVLGEHWEAAEYYDRASAGAREQGYIQEEALAYELAAEFYLTKGREEIAQMYLTKAHYGYINWGAKAKIKDLEERYPQLLSLRQKREIADEPAQNLTSLHKTTVSTTGGSSAAMDLATVIKATQAISGEILLSHLIEKLMQIVMENAGAQVSYLILEKSGTLVIEASATVEQDETVLGVNTPVTTSRNLPLSVINYVERTKESVVLNDAACEGLFTTDSYIAKKQPKSILCAPIINQGKLTGILYLENNLIAGAFTPDRLELLKLLSSQVAISLENARLYGNLSDATDSLKAANEQLEDYSRTLELRVEERTVELQKKNVRLKEQAKQLKLTLQELQTTQTQLIQTEKMSSLGQLVAGVAHEINNPVNFIYGNLVHANEYAQNLLQLIEVYQEEYPNPTPRVAEEIEATELEFLREDLPKLLSSMKMGADRIREIVYSLRNFSRLDEAEMKPVDIHDGINNTLLILQHRLKDKGGHGAIQVIKEYGKLPLIECYAGQLNQVFMNIITNAIDILDEPGVIESFSSQECSEKRTIRIQTESVENNCVVIRITDNGPGMTEAIRRRLFDPFFTTKPVGAGTGLGLSISYQIVVEKHGGQLTCNSAPGEGAEFMITIPVVQSSQTVVAL